MVPIDGAGHHKIQGDALYTHPPLQGVGKNRVPDFMWITSNSNSVIPIFIEIENPSKQIFNSSTDSTFSAEFNQAYGQLTEWKHWWSEPTNVQTFRQNFLAPIFHGYDMRGISPQYILIYGRRSEYKTGSPGQRMGMVKHREAPDEHVITFDRLAPDVRFSDFPTVQQHSDNQLSLKAVPACFTTGPALKDLAKKIPLPDRSAFTNDIWSDARSEYSWKRWLHWSSAQSGTYAQLYGE